MGKAEIGSGVTPEPKKMWVAAVLFFICSFAAFGQAKPRLGILPFVGGSGGDGETIALLFSMQRDIMNAFTVVPRTSAVNALVEEQNFQLSGYTDSDTISRIGRMLNADYVISGSIHRLGNRNLVIVTIVNVETFEQLGGQYREYRNISEVENLLPTITGSIIASIERDTSALPKLAVAPFTIARLGVDRQEAEALAQILAIEIINSEQYAVLPRTTTMQTAIQELEFQTSGNTTDEEAKAIGRATNAEYVLSGEVRSLGVTNMFIAQILHIETGSLHAGDSRNYRVLEDGIVLMPELARLLTTSSEDVPVLASVPDRARAPNAVPTPSQRNAPLAPTAASNKFWSIGALVGTSFIDPWITVTAWGTIAPLEYFFIDIGFDAGFVSGLDGVGSYYSLYPYLHVNFYMPMSSFASLTRYSYSGPNMAFYCGTGLGFLYADYQIYDLSISKTTFVWDALTIGEILFDFLPISYTLRTDCRTFLNHKIAIGYVKRF